MASLDLAKELHRAPPHGEPYSVTVPGSEKEGRTPIYRNCNTPNGPLKTLDPNVGHPSGEKALVQEPQIDFHLDKHRT